MTSDKAMNETRLRIAVQKSGRLSDASLDLLKRCGLQFSRSKDRLFCYGSNMPIDLLLVRDDDIPQLLMDDVVDLGIVGQNVAEEARLEFKADGRELAYQEIRDLSFGQCRLSLAVPETEVWQGVGSLEGRRIATTYPRLVEDFLGTKGVEAQIIKLSGSVEVAPTSGIADAICDLVSTGSTLRANHLVETDVIYRSTACLYQRAKPLEEEKRATLERLLRRIDGVLQVRESKYVMLHAPRSALDAITKLLPGAERPTVLPLEGNDERVAIHAVCRETVFWEHLESLKAAGASAVLVLPVEKMLA
jgi:ATP phosphoribosyltransferase